MIDLDQNIINIKCKMSSSFLTIDIDECASNPCENGGTCTDEVNGYTCACEAGYTDDNCGTSKCCRTYVFGMSHWSGIYYVAITESRNWLS